MVILYYSKRIQIQIRTKSVSDKASSQWNLPLEIVFFPSGISQVLSILKVTKCSNTYKMLPTKEAAPSLGVLGLPWGSVTQTPDSQTKGIGHHHITSLALTTWSN
jgi:hypothetical protein